METVSCIIVVLLCVAIGGKLLYAAWTTLITR